MFIKMALFSTKLFALGIMLSLGLSCAQSSKEKADDAYEKFEQEITTANAEECARLKEECLAALGEAVKERKSELRALQARIGASANRDQVRDNLIAKAIRDMETELAQLTLREDKVKSVECEKEQPHDPQAGSSTDEHQ
jgi:hypothetical protein